MRNRLLLSVLLSLPGMTAPLFALPARAATASSSDQRMVGLVAARIFAEAQPVEGWAWPPLVAISDIDDVNAFASIYDVKPGETPDVEGEGNLTWVKLPTLPPAVGDDALGAEDAGPPPADGEGKADASAAKTSAEAAADVHIVQPGNAPADDNGIVQHEDGTVTQPIIVLYQGFLDKVVQGSPDRLAAVFGHETSHILLHHVDAVPPRAPLVAKMITRDQESAADMLGMKLGLAAGYPYNGLIAGFLGMRDQGNYNSFEGLNATHPGWTDRVAMVDQRQPELWSSISAFENGVYFLTVEQYSLARNCFMQVTRDCPKCYEAWANLGYASLMMYCDALEPEDLRNFDVGQIVVGGFYRRPASLEGSRGGLTPDVKKLWFDAVGALRQALILKPDLVLAKANLAAAYLLNPDGKDVGQAEELFTQVREALERGNVEEMEPLVRASLLVNAGVAEMAGGDPAAADALFAEAEKLFSGAGADVEDASISSAIRFNRGRMYAAAGDAAKRTSAREQLEAYLTSTSSASNWWPLAYEQYAKLCADAGQAAKSEADLKVAANTQYRLVAGVTLPDGVTITLNDPLQKFEASLGKGREQKIVGMVRRLQYPAYGLDLLCARSVVAIRLRGPKAPPVVIRASGSGGESHEVRPGMTVAELDSMLGGDANQWDERYGATQQVVYRFYPRLGFGVRIGGDKIVEIIVAQIPIEAKRT
jgi:Zn-dependent protease with chaperone function